MVTLAEIYQRHSAAGADPGHGDKGSVHSYIAAYEKLLLPYRERCNFMEIGLASGLSMKMWGEYLGPDCLITGADLSICFDVNSFDTRFRFIASDATAPKFLEAIGDSMFDVIIDDASHMPEDQSSTFRLLKDRMNNGGIYIIEDILWPENCLPALMALHPSVEIYDFRKIKDRFDDMLVVYRF